MRKIGRNDSCPCLSGKKFKNCCDKTGIWEDLGEQGLNYFDESYALSDLLQHDSIFAKFYYNERGKINKQFSLFN